MSKRDYGYTIKNGVIQNPGKFEGEAEYVPEFWDAVLDGCGDDLPGGVVSIEVTAEDKVNYPQLKRRQRVRLYEDSQGFVIEVKSVTQPRRRMARHWM